MATLFRFTCVPVIQIANQHIIWQQLCASDHAGMAKIVVQTKTLKVIVESLLVPEGLGISDFTHNSGVYRKSNEEKLKTSKGWQFWGQNHLVNVRSQRRPVQANIRVAVDDLTKDGVRDCLQQQMTTPCSTPVSETEAKVGIRSTKLDSWKLEKQYPNCGSEFAVNILNPRITPVLCNWWGDCFPGTHWPP